MDRTGGSTQHSQYHWCFLHGQPSRAGSLWATVQHFCLRGCEMQVIKVTFNHVYMNMVLLNLLPECKDLSEIERWRDWHRKTVHFVVVRKNSFREGNNQVSHIFQSYNTFCLLSAISSLFQFQYHVIQVLHSKFMLGSFSVLCYSYFLRRQCSSCKNRHLIHSPAMGSLPDHRQAT